MFNIFFAPKFALRFQKMAPRETATIHVPNVVPNACPMMSLKFSFVLNAVPDVSDVSDVFSIYFYYKNQPCLTGHDTFLSCVYGKSLGTLGTLGTVLILKGNPCPMMT